MEPRFAIVIYRGKKDHYGARKLYAEHHQIRNGAIQAGKPFTAQELNRILVASDLKYNFSFGATLLPKNLIHLSFDQGNIQMAWTYKSCKRKIQYSENRLNAIVWHPKLLFVYDGNLSIYVIPEGRIKKETEVYYAPYDNLGTGKLCFGTVKKPEFIKDLKRFMTEMQNSFFYGVFTHGSYLDQWKALAKTGRKLNIKSLKKYGTISQVLHT